MSPTIFGNITKYVRHISNYVRHIFYLLPRGQKVLKISFHFSGYCFKKCVSDKRKKSTDFLDLQVINKTKTKKV